MNFPLIWQEWLIASSIAASLTLLICLWKQTNLGKAAGWTSFSVYLTTLAYLTVLPFPLKQSTLPLSDLLQAVDWIPIRSLQTSWGIVETYLGRGDTGPLHTFLWNNVGNLLVLMPLGLYYYLFFRLSFGRAFLAGIASSFLIELLQALFCWYFGVMYRVIDINDIILNSAGVLFALCLAAIIRLFAKQAKRNKQK